MLKHTYIIVAIYCFAFAAGMRAQLLNNTNGYRNQLFTNVGYYNSFGSYGLGWFHNEHFRFLKRDVTSILDVSFPVSQEFYTRFVFRKGLQTDLIKDSTWKIPFSVVGSSEKLITNLFKIHDFVSIFFLNPGLYTKRYTLALDLDYSVIWFSTYKRTTSDKASAPADAKHIHERFAVGIACGGNYRRFSILFRSGYQQSIKLEHHPYALYMLLHVGYNCNFKKKRA